MCTACPCPIVLLLLPSQALETKLSRTYSGRQILYSLQFYINTVSKLLISQKLLVQDKIKWKWIFLQILSALCCQLKLWIAAFYNNVTIQSQSNIFPDFRVTLTYETQKYMIIAIMPGVQLQFSSAVECCEELKYLNATVKYLEVRSYTFKNHWKYYLLLEASHWDCSFLVSRAFLLKWSSI